jgi:hypothetical protein
MLLKEIKNAVGVSVKDITVSGIVGHSEVVKNGVP